jgi:glutathione peroxidase
MNQRLAFLMAGLAALAMGVTTMAGDESEQPIYGQEMKSLSGKPVDLAKYKGKVLLIVNVASQCGYTPQYEGLQELHKKYGDQGLAVLGFPCNQFGKQEPGTSAEIATFCKDNYGVSFDMFEKIEVNGKNQAPIYKHLTEASPKDAGPVKWNFEKFLVSRDGEIVSRFRSGVDPGSDELEGAIKTELAKK